MIKARVTVTLKNGVLDPQGKVFDIELAGADKGKAEADLKAMCDRLLANTVIENYAVEIG